MKRRFYVLLSLSLFFFLLALGESKTPATAVCPFHCRMVMAMLVRACTIHWYPKWFPEDIYDLAREIFQISNMVIEQLALCRIPRSKQGLSD